MKVYRRGDGEPEITVIGSIHGDEPAGKEAIERVLAEELEFRKPVRFVVANEEALSAGERFIDVDLNRNFPGDPDSDLHEERLAAELLDTVEDSIVLDLHTTHSYPDPFGIIKQVDAETVDRLRATGAEHAVHFPDSSNSLIEYVDGVLVETGYQGSDAAIENAVTVIKHFLTCHGVIAGTCDKTDLFLYEYVETVEGDWVFTAENFELVDEGDVYATRDGEELQAEEPFYPVLMSTEGYEDILGFKAKKLPLPGTASRE